MDQELLDRIDQTIKETPDLDSAKRFTRERLIKLKKLHEGLGRYRDNLVDMLVTIRSMENALSQEIKYVEDRT